MPGKTTDMPNPNAIRLTRASNLSGMPSCIVPVMDPSIEGMLEIAHAETPSTSILLHANPIHANLIPSGSIAVEASVLSSLQIRNQESVLVWPVRCCSATIVESTEGVRISQKVVSALRTPLSESVSAWRGGSKRTLERPQIDDSLDSLVVAIPRDVLSRLGLAVGQELKLTCRLQTAISLQILQHPGFLYLSNSDLSRTGLSSGGCVLAKVKSRKAWLQAVKLDSDDTGTAYVDQRVADQLRIESSCKAKLISVESRLIWAAGHPLSDDRSKARQAICFDPAALEMAGYHVYQNVEVHSTTRTGFARIESVKTTLPLNTAMLTPVLLRALEINRGDGLFVASKEEPFLEAKTGIFNVDEIGDLVVKGSQHLATLFKMPCTVEIVNPISETSIDVRMVPDIQPRREAMVRMPLATRKLLRVERGDNVIVKTIRTERRRALIELASWPLDFLLRTLIGARKIHMSVGAAHLWDDQAEVVRMGSEAFAVLGISPGDRITLIYRRHRISRVALEGRISRTATGELPSDSEVDMVIGVDAKGRFSLGQGHLGFGHVIEVERDMAHLLRKSMNLIVIPLVGTVVTAATLLGKLPLKEQLIVAALLAVLLFYLSLSVERSKVG